MEFYIYIRDNQIIGSGQVYMLDSDVTVVKVSEEIFNTYNEDSVSVVWNAEANEVQPNPEYENILAQRREAEFNKEFFKTSVGYIRRKARMKDGTVKDFITDLIPLMEGTPNIPVIAYQQPDFTKEVTEEILIGLQIMVLSTPELIGECKTQAIIDFYGYNPIELLQQMQQQEESEEPTEEPEVEEPVEEAEIEEPTKEPEIEDESTLEEEE